MRYEVEFRIVDADSTIAKEEAEQNYDLSIRDKAYGREAVDEICAAGNYKRKSDIDQQKYIQTSLPETASGMTAITDDIINYYLTNFELNTDKEEVHIRVRFFLNGRNKGECGDAVGNDIRISCMNLTDNIARQLSFGKGFEEKLRFSPLLLEHRDDDTYVETHKAEYFLLQLRFVLAHEMYHVFHANHYCSVNGKNAWMETKELDNIIMESLADYFAYSYMRYYLEKQYPGQENQINMRWNSIAAEGSKGMKFFGVGRKALISDRYSREELDKDKTEYAQMLQKDDGKYYLEACDARNIVLADYAGGYVLWSYGYNNCKGVQGKALDEYVNIYNAMLEKDAEQALYQML